MSPATSHTRRAPLTARGVEAPPAADAARQPATVAGVPGAGLEQARRDQRFADGLRTLRIGGATLQLNERILMVLGGILAPLGVLVVLLGWWGAAHTPYVFEQLPYVISGGLLGLGLVFLGAFLYFTHWLTQLVKEHRAQSVAVVEALQRLQDQVSWLQDGSSLTAAPSVNGHEGLADEALVATARGTMAHRPGCAVLAGRQGLRQVTAADGLEQCKLCGS